MMGMLTDKAKPVIGSAEHYFADDAATDCLALVESDSDAASRALLIAAGYIRRGEALPGNLADYLADAIELAMVKPQKFRPKALTDELGLTARNRRPAANWVYVGVEIERHISTHGSEDKALLAVSEKYSISKKTAERYWKDYKPVSLKLSLKFQADMDDWLLRQKPPTF